MAWMALLLAILFEVSGTTSMKLSRGLSVPGPTVAIFAFYGMSIALLTIAVKQIEISVAYAVWSGLGTALVAAVGVLWFREAMSGWKAVSIVMIIIGVIGLHLSNNG